MIPQTALSSAAHERGWPHLQEGLCEPVVLAVAVNRPSRASTTMFFLFPKSATSERPLALLPLVIRWWKWLRAPAVVELKNGKIVKWDACSNHIVGAELAECQCGSYIGRRADWGIREGTAHCCSAVVHVLQVRSLRYEESFFGVFEHRHSNPAWIKVLSLLVKNCYAGFDDKSIWNSPCVTDKGVRGRYWGSCQGQT